MGVAAADLPELSRLFDEALAQPPADRESWLAALPAARRHLQAPLREMLAREAATGRISGSLQLPSIEALDGLVTVRADDTIGPYRLIREIGQGGMGTVWLAERADGTLKRQVALKLPRLSWGAGLAERMARERDIGAMLEHPNIARLYDAGVDDKGRPYLALEYIDGQPIDTYCAAQGLDTRARLQLFVQVARAVAYAHGRLVVHRDLKPSNVLVSADGQVHLLDFGIAKFVDESQDTQLTQEFARPLTPAYAAPELLRGEPVTVQCDVYALGVLGYELLSGAHPHPGLRGGVAATLQALSEGEPAPPSARATSASLAKPLRGDVDAIVMKALRHDCGARYASAEALADDIQRHLAGESVRAHPDRLGYRIAKVFRRHRLAVGAGAAVLASVAGGSALALAQAARAQAEAERARVVKDFVVDVFNVNSRDTAARADLRQLPVELLLERGAARIEAGFASQPALRAELDGVVGTIFAQMGAADMAARYAGQQAQLLDDIGAPADERAHARVLWGQALLERGQGAEAAEQARRALALAPRRRETRAQAELLAARALQAQARYAEALAALERLGAGYSDLGSVVAQASLERALALTRSGRFDEATAWFQAAVSQALEAEGPNSSTAVDARLALAERLVLRNRGDEARPLREAALDTLRASGGAGDLRAAREEARDAWNRFEMGQISGAEARRVIEEDRAAVAARGALVPARLRAELDYSLGSVLLDWGDIEGAAPLLDDAARVLGRPGESIGKRFEMAALQGTLELYRGRYEEARKHLDRRMALQKEGGRTEHPLAAYDAAFMALALIMQRRFDEAEAVLSAAPDFDAIARRRGEQLEKGHAPPFAVVRQMLVRSRLERGDAAGARALMLPEETDDDQKFPADSRLLRGAVLCASGDRAAGLRMLEEQIAFHAGTDFGGHPDLGRARAIAGLCALGLGQKRSARELAADAARVFDGHPAANPYFAAPLIELRKRLGQPATVATR